MVLHSSSESESLGVGKPGRRLPVDRKQNIPVRLVDTQTSWRLALPPTHTVLFIIFTMERRRAAT